MSNSWKFFDKQSDKVERVLKTYSLNRHYGYSCEKERADGIFLNCMKYSW